MKKADDYISKIVIVESNLEHIAKSRKINGSLLVDLRRIIEEAQKEAWNEALHWAAENAEADIRYKDGYAEVNQQSILRGLK